MLAYPGLREWRSLLTVSLERFTDYFQSVLRGPLLMRPSEGGARKTGGVPAQDALRYEGTWAPMARQTLAFYEPGHFHVHAAFGEPTDQQQRPPLYSARPRPRQVPGADRCFEPYLVGRRDARRC